MALRVYTPLASVDHHSRYHWNIEEEPNESARDFRAIACKITNVETGRGLKLNRSAMVPSGPYDNTMLWALAPPDPTIQADEPIRDHPFRGMCRILPAIEKTSPVGISHGKQDEFRMATYPNCQTAYPNVEAEHLHWYIQKANDCDPAAKKLR